ncbi:unnamed protein product [Ranitomeya imitator]|uniref:Uncharacterized protein n=1 Tax=Ranitomeya imitator TaxID=111125 RepID=A0ABN9LIZ9_9NEOB|nr:unnamed protein product [Ranitomeya imitator]
MAWSPEPDEQLAEEEVMAMMQGLKIRGSLVLREPACLHEAWSGPVLTGVQSQLPNKRPTSSVKCLSSLFLNLSK